MYNSVVYRLFQRHESKHVFDYYSMIYNTGWSKKKCTQHKVIIFCLKHYPNSTKLRSYYKYMIINRLSKFERSCFSIFGFTAYVRYMPLFCPWHILVCQRISALQFSNISAVIVLIYLLKLILSTDRVCGLLLQTLFFR